MMRRSTYVLGGTMRTRTTILALTLTAALAGCSSGDSTPKAAPSSAASESTTSEKTKLEPVWAPKLEAASEGAVEACSTPSSSDCAESIDRIMTVVDGLDTAIDKTGRRYPQTTAQIVSLQDAQTEYTDEGCEGDPAADDPNSQCWGVSTITLGATTLQMTLLTDDLS